MTSPTTTSVDLAFQRATTDHELALAGTRIVSRNAKGTVLKAVPKAAKESDTYETLSALRDWLVRHHAECRAQVEAWMLGSLPVPTPVLYEIWPDPAWRDQLLDAVVVPSRPAADSTIDTVGLLRAVELGRGIGIVTIDGETEWHDAPAVVIPHPVLIEDLHEVRTFAVDLGVTQTIDQLMRDVHLRPADLPSERTSIDTFAGATFKELRHATSRATSAGFRIRGGFAVCAAFDGGVRVEARYWIGADDPSYEAYTGDLLWVDSDEKPLQLGHLGPVAYSEGTRMASLIHAARHVENADEPVAP